MTAVPSSLKLGGSSHYGSRSEGIGMVAMTLHYHADGGTVGHGMSGFRLLDALLEGVGVAQCRGG